MKRKLLAMAIMLSLALGMAAIPTAAESAANDLLLGTGDFETENVAVGWNSSLEAVNDADGAKSGSVYLAVPEGAAEDTVYGASVSLPVKADTGYTLSFWVKCGSTKSGRVLIRSNVGGQQYSMAETSRSILGDDITVRFGNTVPEGATVSPWREVKRSFVTAPETDSLLLQFYTEYETGYNDLKLCLDNVKLTEGVENLLMNGEMNSYTARYNDTKYGDVPMADNWTVYQTSDGGWNKVLEDPNDVGSGNMVLQAGKYSQVYQQNVPLAAGQYKMSFRYRATYQYSHPGPSAGCILQENYYFFGSSNTNGAKPCFRDYVGVKPQSQAEDYLWMEYVVYFTVPEDGYYAVGVGERWVVSGLMYDDIVLLPAEENTVTYVNPQFASVAGPGTTTYAPVGNITSMRGNKVASVTGGTKSGDAYNLTAIGHYLAENVDATEEFTLLTAVYKKDKETQKISLYSINLEDGESAPVTNTTTEGYPKHNSENIMVNFSVPAEDDTYTYEVKSFMWSSVSGMKPVSEAFELTY
ncbi:MAG: hypothetical protein IJN25_09520 [Clostridia bacterium]|nr:hypothetical protein [Clostridia bacterium]